MTTPTYQYTLDNKMLTSSQRDFYEKNGYLIIKKLIPDDILDKCRDHFVDICEGRVDKGKALLMKEVLLLGNKAIKGEYLYNKIQDIRVYYDEVFSLYSEHPLLLDYVECFTGPNITGLHSMLINKPPGTMNHTTHQDIIFFPFRPANRFVATWTAMEPVFIDNGCLYVVPGSHKGPLYDHTFPVGKEKTVNKAYYGIQNEHELPSFETRLNLIMDKGDTLFLHSFLLHGSGPNLTNNFRKILSCHYCSSECKFINTEGTPSEVVLAAIDEIFKSRGIEMNRKDYWHSIGKLVRGKGRSSFT